MERMLEPVNETHEGILAAAALEGVDVEPAVQGERYICYGETTQGYGPGAILDLVSTPYVIEPHIIWFPWTSPKHRIAHFKWAMQLMAQTHEVLLNVQKDQIGFFEHFVKKGLLRKIGYIENLPIVEEIHMYQYRRGESNE